MSKKKPKLKHSDDYRHKIKKDNQRFNDKVHRKRSKLSDEKSINSDEVDVSKSLKKKRQLKTFKETEEKYAPLDKDLDNDGVIDRFDNDFRDSDYFESTYDVDDKVKLEHKSKKIHRTNKYKRKNYTESLYTRTKQDDKSSDIKDKVSKKTKVGGDKKSKNKLKLTDGIDSKTLEAVAYLGVGKTSENVRDYLANGSDENVGTEAGEKTADISSKLTHGIKRYSDKRKAKKTINESKKASVKSKQTSKLKFERKKEVKTNKAFQKKKAYKKSLKKKQMKTSIYKHKNNSLKSRVKKGLTKVMKALKNIVTSKGKLILALIVILAILLVFIFQFAGTSIMAIINSTTNVATMSYLSSESVLEDINNEFSKYENSLQNELDSVADNYPDYDEYIINQNDDIGHNVHELLSYITARHGEVNSLSDVNAELTDIYHRMYQITYRAEVETRYRTKYGSYTDAEGHTHYYSYQVPYEYKKLYVNLDKTKMDTIIREKFAMYPDNLEHYKGLFLAQGNMAELFGNTDLINWNGGIGGGEEYEASEEVQKKIVDAAYITPSPGSGWCAMWVSQVYQNAGLGYIGGNACDMYRSYTYTSDRSKLEVGMLVAVESSSSGSNAGLVYGHVAIYIGDGKVMDNIGRIRVTTLDNWISAFCQHHPVGYGFPPSVQK